MSGDEKYVYHVSSELYTDIRALLYQERGGKLELDRVKQHGDKSYVEKYFREVNTFPGLVTADDANLLRSKGFVNWGKGSLYVYKIDLKEVEHLINSINVTSTPEQTEFNTKNWGSWYSKHKYLNNEEFFKARKAYTQLLNTYLSSKGIASEMTVDSYMSLIASKDWKDSSKYFKLNSLVGNKKQYASYIPHVQIDVKGPLTYVEVIKII